MIFKHFPKKCPGKNTKNTKSLWQNKREGGTKKTVEGKGGVGRPATKKKGKKNVPEKKQRRRRQQHHQTRVGIR